MVKAQVSSQIRVRDFSAAQISIAPAEHGSWSDVRKSLIAERLAPLRRKLSVQKRAATTDEEIADLDAEFTVKQSQIEADVDHTKFDVHFEVEVKYNFLSDKPPAPAAQ